MGSRSNFCSTGFTLSKIHLIGSWKFRLNLTVSIVTTALIVFPELNFVAAAYEDCRSPLDPVVDPGCKMKRQRILRLNQDHVQLVFQDKVMDMMDYFTSH
jgi:hypothetical protein